MENRSDNKKAEDAFKGGGGAVDDLTPPTMRYGPGGEPPSSSASSAGTSPSTANEPEQNATLSISGIENTHVGPAPTQKLAGGAGGGVASGAAKTELSTPRGQSPTVIGQQQIATVIGDVVAQDLSSEKLLRDAPRVESSGRICPSLNGIPLLAKLGQGGMGAVYYGIHPRLRSEVAVKVLPFHLAAQDPGMIQRFFREAQIAAKVRSPHLVSVIDVNEESGLFFLVMEYVPGITMGQYIKQLAEQQLAEKLPIGMPELDAIDVVIAASMGLDAAHSNGIVHRDLKPENIMVPFKSRQQKVYDLKHAKLMDLGLARSEEGQQSLTGGQAAMGTPGYMAPEQALDAKTADKRSDVFGMGATIYALLSGRPPFKGDAVMKVLMATMHEPHEPIGTHRPDISAALAEIIDHCLDKRPENRYADAHQLMRALKSCRRLIAPDSGFDSEEDGDLPGNSGTTPFTPAQRGTATPNVARGPLGTRAPNLSYARAGAALSTNQGQAAVPKKLPWAALLGAAAVVLLLLGAAGYKFLPRGDVGTGMVKPAETPVELWPESRIRSFQKNYSQSLANARTAIDSDGEPEAASDALSVASSYLMTATKNLPKKVADDSQKEFDAVKQKIAGFKHEKEFLGKLKSIQTMLDQDKVEEAAALLKTVNPASDEERGAFEMKSKVVQEKRLEANNKRQAAEYLASAQKAGVALDEAFALATKARALDPINADVSDLLEKLTSQKKIADNQKKYDDNIAKVQKALGKNDYDLANEAVTLALEAKPGDKAALEFETKITANLGEKEKAAKLKKRADDYLAAYSAANDFYTDKKGIEALEKITLARQYSTLNDIENVDKLERYIKLLVDRQEKEKLALKIKGDYDGKMDKAGKMLLHDDPDSFAAALEYAADAKRLLPGTDEEKAAAELMARIDTRKLEWDNLKAHNAAVSSARQTFLNIKDENVETALRDADSALAKVNEALKILAAGKIALNQLKEPKSADMLRDQIVAKQKVLATAVEKRRQYQKDYGTALASGDEFFKQTDFSGALNAYQGGREAALALGFVEKSDLELKVNRAAVKVEEVNKLLAAVDQLVKEDRFDDAASKLSVAEKMAVDARFAAKKTEIAQGIATLDAIGKKALKDAEDLLKQGKLNEALGAIQKEADAHKSLKNLSESAAALKSIQGVVAAGVKDADGYEARYNAISGRLGEKLGLYQKDYKASVAGLRALPGTAAGKLSAAGLGAAGAEASNLKSVQSKLSADADKNLLKLEEFVRNTAPPPVTNPNVNTGGTDTPPKINKFD